MFYVPFVHVSTSPTCMVSLNMYFITADNLKIITEWVLIYEDEGVTQSK